MCRELFKLARRGGGPDGRPITGTKAQQWYFFFTAAFWLYLRRVTASRRTVRPRIPGMQLAAAAEPSCKVQLASAEEEKHAMLYVPCVVLAVCCMPRRQGVATACNDSVHRT